MGYGNNTVQHTVSVAVFPDDGKVAFQVVFMLVQLIAEGLSGPVTGMVERISNVPVCAGFHKRSSTRAQARYELPWLFQLLVATQSLSKFTLVM